jgi:hypothetical protein
MCCRPLCVGSSRIAAYVLKYIATIEDVVDHAKVYTLLGAIASAAALLAPASA